MKGAMMYPQDLRINGNAECRKAVGHLQAALEYFGWLNYSGSNESDQKHERYLRRLIEDFVEHLEDHIG